MSEHIYTFYLCSIRFARPRQPRARFAPIIRIAVHRCTAHIPKGALMTMFFRSCLKESHTSNLPVVFARKDFLRGHPKREFAISLATLQEVAQLYLRSTSHTFKGLAVPGVALSSLEQPCSKFGRRRWACVVLKGSAMGFQDRF